MYFATMYFYHYVYCIFIRICFIALCRKIANVHEEHDHHILPPHVNCLNQVSLKYSERDTAKKIMSVPSDYLCSELRWETYSDAGVRVIICVQYYDCKIKK